MHPDPRANPLAGNALCTKDDVRRAVQDLVQPIVAHLSPGGARARLGSFGSVFETRIAELEGYARPLWGITPLVSGGGHFAHWDRWVSGLAAGTDPAHDEYWGPIESGPDQRMVEMAAIGFALAFVPEHLWDPLTARQRGNVIEWLRGIERFEPAPNNWQFFRLLVQLGLERVGVGIDRGAQQRSFDLIDSYHLGDGWYHDGFAETIDYYVPFAFHTYGLVLAASGLGDRARTDRFLDRSRTFASDFRRWFADDGAAVPFGRSLGYRFAHCSFWGAAALADEEVLPWGATKGLALRHLRWWSERPISDRDGVLSLGYGYDNRQMSESYNSAGSPYWSLKAFMMLGAADNHAFWTSTETQPDPDEPVATLPRAGMVIGSAPGQAVALMARPSAGGGGFEQATAKYKKFAYSSQFGFSGDFPSIFGPAVTDSMLSVTLASTGERRVRDEIQVAHVADGIAYARWSPFPNVRIDTVLWGGAPWHGRLHQIITDEDIVTLETGFAIPWEPQGFTAPTDLGDPLTGTSVATSPHGVSTIIDLVEGSRELRVNAVHSLAPNANVLAPHTVVPSLSGSFAAGEHLLACAVGAGSALDPSDPRRPRRVPEEVRVVLADA